MHISAPDKPEYALNKEHYQKEHPQMLMTIVTTEILFVSVILYKPISCAQKIIS